MWKYLLTISVVSVLSSLPLMAEEAPFDPSEGDGTRTSDSSQTMTKQNTMPAPQQAAVNKDPRRIWLTKEGRAKVKIDNCADNKNTLCGKIIWLKEPKNQQGQEKTDVHNPDPALQSRKVIGLDMLKGFVKNGEEWVDGEIYNPQNGKTYSCTMSVTDQGNLDLRGYVLVTLFGETQTWTPSE